MTSAERNPKSPGACRRCALWLLLATTAALGCSGEVLVVPGGGPDGEESEGSEETCASGPAIPPPGSAPLAVTGVKSGVFIGDTLHVEAMVDGVPRYLVLAIDAQGVARAVAMPDALLGPANLAAVAPGVHARVRGGEAGVTYVDVVDTAVPESPTLIASAQQDLIIDGPPVFTAAGGHVLFCARPLTGEPALLVDVDLSAPAEPAPALTMDSFFCYYSDDNSYSVAGSTVISWNHPTGSYVQQTYLYTLAPASAKSVMDYGYNQTGVHMYGNVLTAATSEQRAVFDPENEHLFLVADPAGGPAGGSGNPPFTWATLNAGEERRLLGVADTTAYLVTAGGVRAYDLTVIEKPVLLPYEAKIGPFTGVLRTLAVSPDYLAVADDEGTLFLLPQKSPATVGPLEVLAADYVPAPVEPSCSD